MHVNTPESIALGEQIHARYGSWAKARQAAQVVGGVYVLPRPAADPAGAPTAPAATSSHKADGAA